MVVIVRGAAAVCCDEYCSKSMTARAALAAAPAEDAAGTTASDDVAATPTAGVVDVTRRLAVDVDAVLKSRCSATREPSLSSVRSMTTARCDVC